MTNVVYKVGDTFVDPHGNPVDAPEEAPDAQDATEGTQEAAGATQGPETTAEPKPAKRAIRASEKA